MAAVAALAWFTAVVASGWWPKTTREWRFFRLTLAAFTAVCVVAICVFHYV
ncbi:MAG TPA: hypothetical protein VHX13_03045 [Acidobacteriaceae bacterium]|nr:hypothetical protein [Acidobacteriaceae bacterium]